MAPMTASGNEPTPSGRAGLLRYTERSSGEPVGGAGTNLPKKQPLIFLSYRRDDAKNAVEELYRILVNKYGEEGVFRDTASIRAGARYPALLRSKLQEADAVVVVIGPRWIREPRDGQLDWVVEEVALALKKRGTNIFPVLVEDAIFPADALPARIEEVKKRQEFRLRPAHFRADAMRLLRALPQPRADEAIDAGNVARLEKTGSQQQHRESVCELVWGPDGKTLVSGGADGSIAWWKGKTARTKPAHSTAVRHVSFSNDGKEMLSLSSGALRIWTHPGGTLVKETTLSFDDGRLFSMAASPTGPIFVVSEAGKDPQVYTVPDAECEGPLPNRVFGSGLALKAPKPFLATALAFSGDGAGVATGSSDGSVLLWAIKNGGLLWKVRVAKTYVNALAFSPTGSHLASASEGLVCVYKVDGSALLQQKVDGPVAGMAFSPDGNLLACGLQTGAVTFLDVGARSRVPVPGRGPAEASAIAISPDGTRLAVGRDNGAVEQWAAG